MEELEGWNKDIVFPMLHNTKCKSVYAKIKAFPTISQSKEPIGCQSGTPYKTIDKLKKYKEDRDGLIPVYGGATFSIWQPRRERKIKCFVSEKQYLKLEKDSGFDKPKLAYRNMARFSDQRTLIPALVPAKVILNQKAPHIRLLNEDRRTEAYLLGILSSFILDWCVKRVVELDVTVWLLSNLPVPPHDQNCEKSRLIEVIAGRLATREPTHSGFVEWAEDVGVHVGSVDGQKEYEEMEAKLDAVVALLYGLSRDDLAFIYNTFAPSPITRGQKKWAKEVQDRAKRALRHYDNLS